MEDIMNKKFLTAIWQHASSYPNPNEDNVCYESKQYGTDNQVNSKHSQSAALLDIACSSRRLALQVKS